MGWSSVCQMSRVQSGVPVATMPRPAQLDRTPVRYDGAMVALADNLAIPVRSAASLIGDDRVLPVPSELAQLFPEGGLLRGRILRCSGPAARSVALAMSSAAVSTGRWLALIDVDDLPAEALVEFGIPLDRVVSVSSGSSTAEVIGAVLDGFEVVIIGSASMSQGLARRVAQRVRSREAVMIAIAGSGALPVDLELITVDPHWSGIGRGTGRLVSRQVRVERAGRRSPRSVAVDLVLPAESGAISLAEEVSAPTPRLRMV